MAETIKCLSIWQPYPTLILLGAKIYETRSWATPYRGSLAIHASKNDSLHGICYEPYFCDILSNVRSFPLGAIVGICDLVDCLPADKVLITAQEDAFGDFGRGRFAWRLANVRAIEPIPYRGMQGLFDIPWSVVKGVLHG